MSYHIKMSYPHVHQRIWRILPNSWLVREVCIWNAAENKHLSESRLTKPFQLGTNTAVTRII